MVYLCNILCCILCYVLGDRGKMDLQPKNVADFVTKYIVYYVAIPFSDDVHVMYFVTNLVT